MKSARRTLFGLLVLSAIVGIGLVVVWLALGREANQHVAPGQGSITTGAGDRVIDASEQKTAGVGTTEPDNRRKSLDRTSSSPGEGDHRVSQHSNGARSLGGPQSETPESSEMSEQNAVVGRIAPESVQQFVRDCPGKIWMPCPAIKGLAERVARAPDEPSDGWPGWMRDEIQHSLLSVAAKHGFTSIGAKCINEGCVFYVSAGTSMEMFGGDLNAVPEFDAWLSTRPWSEELEELARNTGSRSPVAWRLEGTDGRPYVIWYVVRKRP